MLKLMAYHAQTAGWLQQKAPERLA